MKEQNKTTKRIKQSGEKLSIQCRTQNTGYKNSQ